MHGARQRLRLALADDEIAVEVEQSTRDEHVEAGLRRGFVPASDGGQLRGELSGPGREQGGRRGLRHAGQQPTQIRGLAFRQTQRPIGDRPHGVCLQTPGKIGQDPPGAEELLLHDGRTQPEGMQCARGGV